VKRSTESAPAPFTPLQCPRCGAEGIGRYCSSCGSRLGGRRDLSVKHFLKEAALAVTDFDSALIATFRSLVTRPGQLTVEYLYGARHRYLPPFRVFLLCNLLYFVAVDRLHISVLTAPLDVQADEMMYRNTSRAILAKRYPLMTDRSPARKAARDSLRTAVTTKYDAATEGLGKLIVVVLIPVYALLFQVMFIGAKRFFVEHLVFSTYFVSLFLLAIPVAGYVAALVLLLLSRLANVHPSDDNEAAYIAAFTALIGLYAYFGQRRVYQSGRIATLIRTAAIAVTLVYVVVAFKFTLFLVTLAWIR
jgi:hypothetical protein